MKYLLDTHALIWAFTEPERLSDHVKQILSDRQFTIVVSAISFWEISLKFSLGKLDLASLSPEDFSQACLEIGFEVLDLTAGASGTYHNLTASYHKDPFDRMLIWQALYHKHALISNDDNIKKYISQGLEVVW